MKISVVLPVYNTKEEYLRESIESILTQTFGDFELILINDGSTNNAEDIILSYKDQRIRYIKNEENLGLIKTLNKGLKLAQGEYIARMDADDISRPQRFEKQADFLDKNPEVDILGTWFNYFPRQRIVQTQTQDKQIKEHMIVNSNQIGHPTVMFRKKIVSQLNAYYDEEATYAEDYALWLSLLDRAVFANLPEVLLDYRIHPTSICQSNEILQNLQVQRLMTVAQGKYFGLNVDSVLEIIAKIESGQKLLCNDTLIVKCFYETIKSLVQKEGFSAQYEINKVFRRKLIKKLCLFERIKYIFNKRFNKTIFFVTEKPKISAVMALYNTPLKLFKRTLKSILNQTYQDFELLIIDDASKIDYSNYLNKIKDSRLKYFRLDENSGPGNARNVGIKMAKGEFVAIVDSDDIYLPKRFEMQADFLDKNPDVSLISGGLKFSNNNRVPSILIEDAQIKAAMLFNSQITNPCVMFRKNDFVEKNLFYPDDINFAEDYALWIDAMFKGIKMANLQELLMIYVRRKKQLSKTKCAQQAKILKDLYHKIFTELGMDVSDSDIDLHYNLECENFSDIASTEVIENWFERIIEHNKSSMVIEPKELEKRRDRIINKYLKRKDNLFRVKIGCHNLCLSRKMTLRVEKRC